MPERPRHCWSLLFLDGFHRDVQRDFVAHGWRIFAGIEFRALDLGAGVGAADFFFGEGMWRAVERRHCECNWLGYTLDGQVAGDCRDFVAIKFETAGLESNDGEFFNAEIVFALDVTVEEFGAGVDRLALDADIERTGFGGTVDDDFAGGLVKFTLLGGKTHVTLSLQISHAGAIFLGAWTPEAIGDYVGGPNHVLPTARSARFSSGLSVLDFVKRTTLTRMTPAALAEIGPAAERLAQSEGLQAHGLSVRARLDRLNRDAG